MANKINEVLETAAAIAKGMSVTFKEMMSPTITDLYPEAPPVLQERYRGVHVLPSIERLDESDRASPTRTPSNPTCG